MNQELKPCPFCGGAAEIYDPPTFCGCRNVRCSGFYSSRRSKDWNTRPREQELEAALLKAKEALERIERGWHIRESDEQSDIAREALAAIEAVTNKNKI